MIKPAKTAIQFCIRNLNFIMRAMIAVTAKIPANAGKTADIADTIIATAISAFNCEKVVITRKITNPMIVRKKFLSNAK